MKDQNLNKILPIVLKKKLTTDEKRGKARLIELCNNPNKEGLIILAKITQKEVDQSSP
jgi:hypothetical protein